MSSQLNSLDTTARSEHNVSSDAIYCVFDDKDFKITWNDLVDILGRPTGVLVHNTNAGSTWGIGSAVPFTSGYFDTYGAFDPASNTILVVPDGAEYIDCMWLGNCKDTGFETWYEVMINSNDPFPTEIGGFSAGRYTQHTGPIAVTGGDLIEVTPVAASIGSTITNPSTIGWYFGFRVVKWA